MPFAANTKPRIALAIAMPISAGNMQILGDRLTEIEAIENGSMIQLIEDLLNRFFAIKDTLIAPVPATGTTSTTGSGAVYPGTNVAELLIKANNVEFSDKRDPNQVKINQLRSLLDDLSAMLGLNFGNSGGISMIRSDRYSTTGYGYRDDRRFISR